MLVSVCKRIRIIIHALNFRYPESLVSLLENLADKFCCFEILAHWLKQLTATIAVVFKNLDDEDELFTCFYGVK